MANEEDSNKNQIPKNSDSSRPQRSPDDNPFVAFRRFADEQISSVLQSVMGLPSMASSPSQDRWAVFGEDYNSNNTRHRNQDPSSSSGSGDSSNTPNNDDEHTSVSRWPPRHDTSDSRELNHQRRRDEDDGIFSSFGNFGSFFDRFSSSGDYFPLSSHFFPPELSPDVLPFMEGDEDMPMWPLLYIMGSPYSPLNLEREARYRAHRNSHHSVLSSLMSSVGLTSEPDPPYERDSREPEWRDAFEDLLRLKYGKSMLDRTPGTEGVVATQRQTANEWLSGLINRGSLGDGWSYDSLHGSFWLSQGPRIWQARMVEKGKMDEPTRAEVSAEARPSATELDIYEQFLQDIEKREREFEKESTESSILRCLSEERQRHEDEIAAYRARLAELEKQGRSEGSDGWLDSAPNDKKRSGSTVEEVMPTSPASELSQHVLSTQTTTERVSLADGSVRTKTIKTQRFADGREESNESVEVTNAPQESPASDDSKGGWFWKR